MRRVFLQIALRNIFRQPRRSFLTILAISFSVFCIIIFQALKVGMHQKMIEGALSLDHGTLQIHAQNYEQNVTLFQSLPLYKNIEQKLEDNGITAYSARIKTPALVLAGQRSSSVMLSGIIAKQEEKVTLIHQRMSKGTYLNEAGESSVLMGEQLAHSLKLDVGDTLTLMLQDVFGHAVVKKIPICGLFATGLPSFDRSHIYLPLKTLQKFLAVEDEVTEIALWTNPEKAAAIAASLKADAKAGKFKVTPWQELTPDLVQLIDLNDATLNFLFLLSFLSLPWALQTR